MAFDPENLHCRRFAGEFRRMACWVDAVDGPPVMQTQKRGVSLYLGKGCESQPELR